MTYDPTDMDAAFADVLARAAALPELNRADYYYEDQYVDALIELVVEHSTLRLQFPGLNDERPADA